MFNYLFIISNQMFNENLKLSMSKTEKNLLSPSLLHFSSDTPVLSNAFPKTLVSSFKSLFPLYTIASLAANPVSSTSKTYLEANHILPSPLLPLGPSHNYFSPRLLQ